jgi:hypothetical protein
MSPGPRGEKHILLLAKLFTTNPPHLCPSFPDKAHISSDVGKVGRFRMVDYSRPGLGICKMRSSLPGLSSSGQWGQ